MCVLSLAKSSGKQSFGREHITKNFKIMVALIILYKKIWFDKQSAFEKTIVLMCSISFLFSCTEIDKKKEKERKNFPQEAYIPLIQYIICL